jgi:rod shape-determining protein MreB
VPDLIDLVDLDSGIKILAQASNPATVRSLGAIRVATALRLQTYRMKMDLDLRRSQRRSSSFSLIQLSMAEARRSGAMERRISSIQRPAGRYKEAILGDCGRHLGQRTGVMRLRASLAIDLGTVNTLVSVAGRGLVVEEPSAIAVDRATGSVAAVGQAADALVGKEARDVEIIYPLRDGVIADLDASVAMLQAFLRRARVHRGLMRPSAVVCVPGGATMVERRSLAAAAAALRPRCAVRFIDEPVAAAAGAGFDLAAGSGAFIVDVGGGTTEVAVLVGAHVVHARSLRLGGNAMDEAIAHAVKAELGLLLGRNAARSLKMTLGLGDGATGERETVGVDAARRTPRVERVPADLVAAALEHPVAAIIDSVQDLLSDIPPNLAEDVVRGKIRLAGGGALLPGLASRIEAAAGIPAFVVDDPLRCVIRGAAEILERGDGFAGTHIA